MRLRLLCFVCEPYHLNGLKMHAQWYEAAHCILNVCSLYFPMIHDVCLTIREIDFAHLSL